MTVAYVRFDMNGVILQELKAGKTLSFVIMGKLNL